jgi:hypothetical protein
MNRSSSTGDTIVEVLVAFSVFALIAIGVFSVMNRGMGMAQNSLEVTLVREQIDSQAELLRFARDTDSDAWRQIKSELAINPGDSCPAADSLPSAAFYLNIPNGGSDVDRVATNYPSYQSPETYSQVEYGSNSVSRGLWVVPVAVSTTSGLAAYDMYIRACWDGVGSSRPLEIGTIVRLYDT